LRAVSTLPSVVNASFLCLQHGSTLESFLYSCADLVSGQPQLFHMEIFFPERVKGSIHMFQAPQEV
jgi:hypothetical protein